LSFQDIILKLEEFWTHNGCYLASGYDNEVGAGTMTPDTFFRVTWEKTMAYCLLAAFKKTG